MRKSAERSIDLRAARRAAARASFIATPFGVAKNTTSQPRSASALGSVKARSTRPRRLGNIAATGVPASLREVMALQLDLRMLREQPQQLDARVPRAADDARP